MKDLIIAIGLLLFIEGILYALFPSKMKNMLKKMELIKVSQLRSGGLIFAVLGFIIIYCCLIIPEFPKNLKKSLSGERIREVSPPIKAFSYACIAL